jgi:predicted DNA-binding ribbon-helix-helix protein
MGPNDPRGKSLVAKRSVYFTGRKTSVHLERAFWAALHEIAAAQGITRGQLIATIDSQRHDHQQANLSSAIRVFVLEYYRGEGPQRGYQVRNRKGGMP